MTSDEERVVFMAGCEGLLAHSRVRDIAAPKIKFAFHAGFSRGLEALIDLARAQGAQAISVSDAEVVAEAPMLLPAAERCVRELGNLDVVVKRVVAAATR